MLDARVVSSRSSDSLKAKARTASSPTTPMTRSPDRIGTPSQDCVTVPPTSIAPSASWSSMDPRRIGRFVRITVEVMPGPSGKLARTKRSPASMSYGKAIESVPGRTTR